MIRLHSISQAIPLLTDPQMPNLKILALFRDPRAMLSSRAATFHGKTQGLYGDEEEQCLKYEDNLKAAIELGQKLPERVKLIRYEDLALEPESKTKEILDFIGLPMVKQIQDYIEEHTTQSVNIT